MTPPETDQRRSPWLGVQGVGAVLILVATALWRGMLLNGSFFNQDDYYLTSRALAETTWSWSYLMTPVAGHVMPLQHATYWLVAHHLPFDWATVSLLILAAQLASGAVAWHLLTLLMPGRWARLPLLGLLMWAPLTLATTLWWSASMGLWPHVLMALVASVALVRERLGIGRTWTNLLVCLLALLVGLGWHERSVLIAPLLVGIAVAMSSARGWRRLTDTLRRFWVLWVVYGVGLGAYLALHVRLTTVDAGTASVREYFALSGVYLFENALPGLVGGPWTARLRGGAVIPPLWVSIVSGLLVLTVAIVLLRRGRADARWAMVLLVGYIGADLALVLAGRVGFGRILGYDPRYSADLVLPAVLCVALALRRRPPPGASRPSRLGRLRGAPGAALATGLVLVACGFGTAALVPHFQNPDDREYWENVRAGLAADQSQVLLDEMVPTDILLPLLEEEAMASAVFGPLPENPVFDQPSPHLRTITRSGRLERVNLLLPAVMRPGPDPGCGYAVGDRPRFVRLRTSVAGRFVVRISYFTNSATDVGVRIGDHDTRFRAYDGPNDVWIVVPEQGAVRSVRLESLGTDPSSAVCIAGLVAGIPESS